jgi:hypothetical protein
MSERDEGGKWAWGFVPGVVAGFLLARGIGAALLMAHVRRAEMVSK